MWWSIAIGVLVVALIVYAEWRDRRGSGHARTASLDTVSSNSRGEPRPLDGMGGVFDV